MAVTNNPIINFLFMVLNFYRLCIPTAKQQEEQARALLFLSLLQALVLISRM